MREELIIEKTKSKCFNVTASQIDSLRINSDVKTTVRLYDGEHIGIAGKIGSCDIEALRKEARENLALGISYPDMPNAAESKSADTYKEILPESELVPAMKKLLARVAAENPDFLFSNKIILEETEETYQSGETSYSYRGNALMISLVLKYKGSANIMDDAFGAEYTSFDEDAIASDIKKLCDGYLKKAELPAEDEAIFLQGQEIIYRLFSHFTADYYANNLSLFSGKKGEKIFSDKLTVSLDRNPDTKANIPFFDAEGVVTPGYKIDIVKDGVFNALLATKKHAAQYALPDYGTAAAEYNGIPTYGAAGVTIQTTAKTPEEIVGDKPYIMLSMASGGDLTPDGTYSTPVQCAYLIQNGEFIGRLPEFALTCNIKDAFGGDYLGCAETGVFPSVKDAFPLFKAKIVNRK